MRLAKGVADGVTPHRTPPINFVMRSPRPMLCHASFAASTCRRRSSSAAIRARRRWAHRWSTAPGCARTWPAPFRSACGRCHGPSIGRCRPGLGCGLGRAVVVRAGGVRSEREGDVAQAFDAVGLAEEGADALEERPGRVVVRAGGVMVGAGRAMSPRPWMQLASPRREPTRW